MNTQTIRTQIERAVSGNDATLFFLDRHGDFDAVAIREGLYDEDSVYSELLTEANHQRPCFQICTVVNGVALDNSGEPFDFDDVPVAVKDAEDERIRFYSEREQVYGVNAWPVRQRLSKPLSL
jgi:hypothetical protein